MEDYKHEKSLGHQVQEYEPPIQTKYQALPASIEVLFEKDVAKVVSNKLPGYQDSELRYLTFLYTCPLSVLWGAEQPGPGGGAAHHPPGWGQDGRDQASGGMGNHRTQVTKLEKVAYRLHRGRDHHRLISSHIHIQEFRRSEGEARPGGEVHLRAAPVVPRLQ